MTTVEVRVLGRPSLLLAGKEVGLGARQKQLVCRLAVAHRRAASVEQLCADLWGDAGSTGALRVTISRIRDLIGKDRVQFVDGSYRLVDVTLDADDFEAGLAAARATPGPIEERIDAYDLALSTWHGHAFEGLHELDWVRPIAHRLDELHEQSRDEWAELLLRAGRHEQIAIDLAAALHDDPTRERRCRLVALAQYRAGRQAEALDTIDRTRRRLRDELGLHIDDDLEMLERRLLRHDPTLQLEQAKVPDTADIEALLRSAVVLIRAGAYREARTIVDDADQLVRGADDERAHALVLLARAQLAMSQPGDDPHQHLDEAQAIGRRLRDGPLLANTALIRFGAGVPHDWTRALIDLTEPIPLLDPQAPERVDLLCAGAAVVALSDGSTAARRLVEEAERTHSAIRTNRSRAVVLVARSLVASLDPNRLRDAVADAQAAIVIAGDTGDDTLAVTAIQALLRVCYTTGALAEAEALIPTLELSASRAILPFGRVRAAMCRASASTVRGQLDAAASHAADALATSEALGTYAADSAVRAQSVLIAIERDEHSALAEMARQHATEQPLSLWQAVAAIAGDAALSQRLIDVVDDVPRDSNHGAFCALAAEVAARDGDARLGAWARSELVGFGDQVIVVGFGTSMLGFAAHFLGLAHVACGDDAAAVPCFERAATLARRAGAPLWEGHSLAALVAARHRRGSIRDLGLEARLRELARLDAPRLRRVARAALDRAPERLGAASG